jgi:ComF family protein
MQTMELSETLSRIAQQTIQQLNRFKKNINQCILCHGDCHQSFDKKSESISTICQFCLEDLPVITPTNQFSLADNNLLMQPHVARTISHEYFDELYCLSLYQWPISVWLNQLKYHRAFELANTFASLLTLHFSEQLTHSQAVITSVPIHHNRWQERGYNQSYLILNNLAKKLTLTHQPHLLYRTKNTEKQVGKNGVERRKNLKNAFTITPSNQRLPEHIILFDDVITTGTTVNEISKYLKTQGVKKITVLTVALALAK